MSKDAMKRRRDTAPMFPPFSSERAIKWRLQPNADTYLRPKADATQERTLEAVRCSTLIMIEGSPPHTPVVC